VAGGWRRLHNEELHNLYTSPRIFRLIQSSRKRCAGLVASMRREMKRNDCSEDPGVDGRIMSEWILGKYGGKLWSGFIWLMTGTSGGFL